MLAVAAMALAAAAPASAQDTTVVQQQAPLRVFLDCNQCDFDHLRREVAFVDYVRDRADAQLHVLVTSQGAGAGGTEHVFYFIGLREFTGREDTLRFFSAQTETEDEERSGITRTFMLGVVPYAARTPMARALSVEFEPDEGPAQPPADAARDPWNLWVFRVRLGGDMEGESRSSSISTEGSLSASRVTEQMKLDFSINGDYSEDRFELSSGEELISTTREFDADATLVWSVGTHWSAGLSLNTGSSIRVNQDLSVRMTPALEFSLYPYDESTRRQITVLYTVGPTYYDYDEITLFDRLSETRFEQELEISASFQQPWGEIDGSLEGSMFMHDPAFHRVDLFAGLEIRLFRGLNLDVGGNVARIKNQIYVPREDIPDEDILLRRRELGTDFEYEMNFGISFTFGSVFNNVVNPRLNRGGRDFN
jgi:hypothetical protein